MYVREIKVNSVYTNTLTAYKLESNLAPSHTHTNYNDATVLGTIRKTWGI